MATRGINKLSALQVKKAKPDPDKMYKLSDGGNLYLRIDQGGSKYWIFNYTRPFLGKRNEPYRVCRRVNILRDYPDDKTKLYPRN